jgi:hypothetical protein
MTIFKRIVVSLPLALGMALFMTSVFALLDAYEATERYRAKTDSIVDSYARQGQVPESSAEERIELVSDLFFIRFDMDRGSFSSIRLRIFGGLLLIGLGAWIGRRAKAWGDNRDSRRRSIPTKEEAESGPRD